VKKIKPSTGVILIQVDEPEKQDEHGVFIQQEWKELPPTGVVHSTGSLKYKKGTRVFFERFSAIATPFGENIKACREDAILATYEE
jgi:co-chaperonin GroES (HSP10)